MIKDYHVEIYLVDHHTIRPCDEYFFPCVVEIYDHRPIDSKSKILDQKGVITHIEEVASCASLVGRKLLALYDEIVPSSLATLLYSKS